jgi:hypothetical protein
MKNTMIPAKANVNKAVNSSDVISLFAQLVALQQAQYLTTQ